MFCWEIFQCTRSSELYYMLILSRRILLLCRLFQLYYCVSYRILLREWFSSCLYGWNIFCGYWSYAIHSMYTLQSRNLLYSWRKRVHEHLSD